VLTTGTAGGLDKDLSTGDAVLAEVMMGEDGKERISPDKNMFSQAKKVFGSQLLIAPIVTVDEPVCTIKGKAELRARHGAAACEMESLYVARVCAARSLPWVAIRFISDQAQDGLLDTDHFMFDSTLVRPVLKPCFAEHSREGSRYYDYVDRSHRAAKSIAKIVPPLINAFIGE
jgi:nucleoside phosphorylase